MTNDNGERPYSERALAVTTAVKSLGVPGLESRIARILESYNQHTETGGDPWQPFTLADAYKPRAPVQYIVRDLFELPSLSIVYGAPGCLKSFLLADLACCVAAGLPWLPGLPDDDVQAKPTMQCPVAWCDFDNGRRRTDERFDALGRVRNLSPDIPLVYYSMPTPWLEADDHDSMGDLGDRVLQHGAKLVVIDNLGAVAGKADENSSEMVRVLSNFRRLTEQTGAAIVVIHHQRKTMSGNKDSRAGESLRGHSSIEAALDLALLVMREEGSNSVIIKATKSRGVLVSPFGAIFTYDHDAAGNLVGAKMCGESYLDTTSDNAITSLIIAVVEQNRPINQTQLIEAVQLQEPGVGRDRVRTLAARAVRDGDLVATTGKRNARMYDVPF